jgi:hypothetical protein
VLQCAQWGTTEMCCNVHNEEQQKCVSMCTMRNNRNVLQCAQWGTTERRWSETRPIHMTETTEIYFGRCDWKKKITLEIIYGKSLRLWRQSYYYYYYNPNHHSHRHNNYLTVNHIKQRTERINGASCVLFLLKKIYSVNFICELPSGSFRSGIKILCTVTSLSCS